jgi:exopolyphosphatase/guanosine-5'-triphosphate,3'-diphosphate pyrophosphatase
MSLRKIKELRNMVAGFTLDERIYKLQMNPDRADVIIPASDIYLKVMEWAHSTAILVPEVGLKDGVMLHLYEQSLIQKRIDFSNDASGNTDPQEV